MARSTYAIKEKNVDILFTIYIAKSVTNTQLNKKITEITH